AHARVLDHVAGHDFGFAFHDVEGVASSLGHDTDDVDDEQRQQRQPVPGHEVDTAVCKPAHALPAHDAGQVQRARYQQHSNQYETDGQFIGEHLGRCAQRAEEGKARVRCPAGNDDAVYAD